MIKLMRFFLLSIISVKRVIVVLDLPRDLDDLIIELYRLHDSMAASPFFAGLAAKLAAFKIKIDKFNAYHIAAHTSPPTKTVAERDAAMAAAIGDVHILQNDVQSIVDAAAPEDRETIATASGMKVKKQGEINKQDFEARHGEVSGSVKLIAKGAGTSHAAHDWQISLNSTDWTFLTTTLQADTMATGLTVGSKVFFRHRTILADGPTDWSQDEEIIVN